MIRRRLLKTSTAILLPLILGCARIEHAADMRYENALIDTYDLEYFVDEDEAILPSEPLTITDVIRIVLRRNLDLLAQQYELIVQQETARAEQIKMLPSLTLDGLYQVRTKTTASFTKILSAPFQPTQAQLSSIKETRTFDIRDTFNLLDFGLAYFRSRQEKYRTNIIDQRHLRFRQKLILDTVEAYWKAAAAQKVLRETRDIMVRSEQLHQGLDRAMNKRLISQVQGLEAETHILDAELEIYAVQHVYESSKVQLAGFMGLLPGTYFELADIDMDVQEIPLPDIEVLEEQAFLARPELSLKDQEERIARESARMAILQMFPNVALFSDYDGDGNPFLLFHYWYSAGLRATWNLLSIPAQWHYKGAAEMQEGQAYHERLALSIAVLTQVRLAYLGYHDALRHYQLAKESYDVRSRLAYASELEFRTGEFQGTQFLQFASDAVLAKVIALRAYAQLQLAIEQINYAVGIPLLVGDIDYLEIYES